MSYATLGLPLAAAHIDHPYSQQEQPPQNASVYKWRLVLSYDGTRFAGWQYQPTPPTLQCILEQALTRVTKVEREELCLVGASRTDKGVHALGQVAHFFTPFNYDGLHEMHAALNGILPPDVRVREISSAVPEFHARFSVTGKIYRYNIYNDTVLDPFHRLYAFHNLSKLNTCVMKEAAKYFVGKHDFSSFANTQRNDRQINPVKDISRVDIIEKGPLIHIEIEGSGFLYRQVRNMVALLLQIGREALPPDIVPKILATRDRKELANVALVAPPYGLFLVQVNYNEEHLRPLEDGPATSFGATESLLRVAATGHDKRLFPKVVVILYVLSALGRMVSGITVAYAGVSLFCLYILAENSSLFGTCSSKFSWRRDSPNEQSATS